MMRLNILLLLAVLVCALSLVSAQHRARRLFQAMDAEQERARQIEVEFGQLQLELSTLAKLQRIENDARRILRMHTPEASQIVIATPGERR